MSKLRTAVRNQARAALGAAAAFAGRTLRWAPGLAAAACFVTAGWLIAVPLGVALAGVFCLWADWRLR